MITIDKVDFTKLKSYDGKSTKCFEHLCYQLAQREYGNLGTFTPIDGSGGDGGVEFYLELDNGEKWGWQCKFFGDSGRLNISSRDTAVEKSLETAVRNHNDITKWFLCTKTDFTADSLSKSGKFSKGEKHWFENWLTKKIPSDKNIKLEHWGESVFLDLLKDPKNIGIRSFFFGELEFDQSWFKRKFFENFEKVKDKYDPELHSIDKFTQSIIDFLLFNRNYVKMTGELKKELLEKSDAINIALSDFYNASMLSKEEETQIETYYYRCKEFKYHIDFVFEKIDFIESCFVNGTPSLLSTFKLEELNEDYLVFSKKIKDLNFLEDSRVGKDANDISYLISGFQKTYNIFFRNYFHQKTRELHFIADAAKGKTHISCDIAYKKILESMPAIFITGDKFTNETSIIEAFRKILDIPQEFTFNDFLHALDVYAAILNVHIPIIIDGLNETTTQRLFSPIWESHLSGFISNVLQTERLVIITTCRNSYVERIWNNSSKSDFHYIYGFEDYETIKDAIGKYFTKYKLKSDLFFASIEKFRDPIFLKIFCEIKNPNWKSSSEVFVNVEIESYYDVFTEYLNQINKRVTNNSPILRTNEKFITATLNKFSNYLWDNNLREMPIEDFYTLIDGTSQYEKDKSKADILINEGLVVTRDMRDKSEYISFTYDILAGYMIGEYLIKNYAHLSFFISDEFIQKISNKKEQHPFFEDIISALCILLIQLKKTSFHELVKNINLPQTLSSNKPNNISISSDQSIFIKYVFDKSVSSLFVLPAKVVKEEDVNLVKMLFLKANENKIILFRLSLKTLADWDHPLNAVFLSDLLAELKMNERDLSWTEHIRKESYVFEDFILEFETQCRITSEESDIIVRKQHILSKILVWLLTSTNRNLRDKATKALYYYGRKFPHEFIMLVCESLKFNDPYVWERTLAALYGVTMAEHNSINSDYFRNKILPELTKTIYHKIFKKNAQHSTTHILARDYARRTIEIGLLYFPDILTENETNNIRPPYSFGGIRKPKQFNYSKHDYGYYKPIQMDFSNYTIGRIVKNGHSYSDPPEKIKVRKQIYWRIYDLGWHENLFKDIEKDLEEDNYPSRTRNKQATVERYGKKYSWIAFYENAGLRDDLGLLNKDDDKPRISDSDIDPSFPEKSHNQLFFKHNLLGDKSTSLIDWYEGGDNPFIEEYLNIKDLNGNTGDWICLDAYISQEDISLERNRFACICGLIIKEDIYDEVMKYLRDQDVSGGWLPNKNENYYTFAGELYYCSEATHDNDSILNFEVERRKIKVKRGEDFYEPGLFSEIESFKTFLPDEIETEISTYKEFEVLIPVMQYNWENHHSTVNNAGHTTVPGKEIVNYLGLVNQPQSFDLLDNKGLLATANINFHNDFNNNHSFVYLRKDLLDKYLYETQSKLVSIIYGERDVRFKTDQKRNEFFDLYPFKDYQVFQNIIEYK